MMMKSKVTKGLAAILSVGILFGSVTAHAEAEAEKEAVETQEDMNIEEQNSGINEEGHGPGNGEGTGPANREGHGPGEGGAPMGRGNGNGGGGQAQTDPELQAVIDETAPKFEQFTYTDEATGITLEYSLYIPSAYDENADTSYPMVMFIPDATGDGKSASQIIEDYYGAAVWASDEDQSKHPSFVLVPAYTEVVTDDNWNASEQLDATVGLIEFLTENYNIDTNRLYTTGQSMGCMSSLYLNSKYPDLFAASLYVSGQWDISVLEPLENQSFFYVTAGGDAKASGGQDEVMALFDQDQISYSYETWDAQSDDEQQNANVQEMIDAGNTANMIRFETGTVLSGENNMEHMASFNYAYKISALRDWLFTQSKA